MSKAVVGWVMSLVPVMPSPTNTSAPLLRGHAVVEQRSLEMHRLVGQKLLANPTLLERARANLTRWQTTGSSGVQHALDAWQEILARPMPMIVAFLESNSEEAIRLRQSSPFTGILTAAERTAIYKAHALALGPNPLSQ
jgi:hypothetical protein